MKKFIILFALSISCLTMFANGEEVFQLGEDYFYGLNGKDQNYTQAVQYYQQAADSGHTSAMYKLADCYYYGLGVAVNKDEAYRWYNLSGISDLPNDIELLVEEARRKREEEARRKADLFAKNFAGSENDPSGNDSDKDGSNPQEGTAVGKGSGSMGGGKWQLSGRDCLSLPRPENKHKQAGKVVVNITIDVNGNVTGVSLGVGSSISDRATIQLALDAAWKAKFTPGDRPQRGTITYIFKLI